MDVSLGKALAAGIVVIALSIIIHRIQDSQPQFDHANFISTDRSATSLLLKKALPDSVFFGPHPVFVESIQSYWAVQERDIVPQCIVRPRTDEEVVVAIGILKQQYDDCTRQGRAHPLFAVRSGGHSPIPGAANIDGGIVIDLQLLDEVVPSEDGSRVAIGTGARWLDVSAILDRKCLAVAGGRNSAVGVGGLTLGGGISFFSPRVGFVCNNIISYEIVLANGTKATASEKSNPGLWRALKGGSNNFGIVTRFVARSFPSTDIWSGFLYMMASKSTQVIQAFYNYTQTKAEVRDEYAAGPLLCFTYLQKLGIKLIATNLVYTKPEPWPSCYAGFRNIGRLWSTVKLRSLTSATNELASSSPAGLRQKFITTTVVNDHATLMEVHASYEKGAKVMRKVKSMIWTLVLQPLYPSIATMSQPNVLGLDTRTEPLVIVLFTAVWEDKSDDELVARTTRDIIASIDHYAASRGTADPYRYLNDCDSWQNPFDGYGAENKRFLQAMSREYDPDGLFQSACVGGFKLGMYDQPQ
ncbi:MAG: hypothetical protein Q9174_004929 [Haloplaca sp. 1 TL-2023]